MAKTDIYINEEILNQKVKLVYQIDLEAIDLKKEDLTEKKLDEIISKVRNQILELYYTCEKDFKNGLQIFEAIVKERYLKTSIARSKDLEKKMDILVSNDMPADVKQDIKQRFTDLANQAIRTDK